MSTYLGVLGLMLAMALFVLAGYEIFGYWGGLAATPVFVLLLIGYAIYVSEREGKNKSGEEDRP